MKRLLLVVSLFMLIVTSLYSYTARDMYLICVTSLIRMDKCASMPNKSKEVCLEKANEVRAVIVQIPNLDKALVNITSMLADRCYNYCMHPDFYFNKVRDNAKAKCEQIRKEIK